MALLLAREISINLGNRLVLEDLDLQVDAGEVVAVGGPPGAGKTTLANVLAGVFRPSRGQLLFDGHSLRRLSPQRIAALGLALVHYHSHPFSELCVRDNVLVGAHLRDVPDPLTIPAAVRAARRALEMVQLRDKFTQRPRRLSQVERRLLLLARAVVASPRLLIVDDILSGLEGANLEVMLQSLSRIHATGVSLLIFERDPQPTVQLAHRLVRLQSGRVIPQDSSAGVLPQSPSIA